MHIRRLLILVFLAMPAWAQGTDASLSGTVTDSTGALFLGARVAAENVATGVVLNTISNNSGVYVFPALQPGTYRIIAEHAGFQKMIYNDIALEVAGRATLDVS